MPGDSRQEELQRALGDCVLRSSWAFSVLGCLVAIPLGIRHKSLAPLVFYGGGGAMLDINMGVSSCEKERAALQQYIDEKKQQKGSPVSEPASVESSETQL